MKKCCKCKFIKEENCFTKRKRSKDGLRENCKECDIVYGKTYRENNLNKVREASRTYKANNKNKIREYRKTNKEKIKQGIKEWIFKNKKRWSETVNQRKRERNMNDLNYRLKNNLSCRIRSALKSQSILKSDFTTTLLGCSIDEFKLYIESKFTLGMSWDNRCDWHIDHIRPCSSFDLLNEKQQYECFHYTNLQPLWATTAIARKYGESIDYIGNIEKGNKL